MPKSFHLCWPVLTLPATPSEQLWGLPLAMLMQCSKLHKRCWGLAALG